MRSVSMLDLEGFQSCEGKEGKRSISRMRWVCQLIDSDILCSEEERSRERQCDTCNALLDIHTFLKTSVSMKISRSMLIAPDIVESKESWRMALSRYSVEFGREKVTQNSCDCIQLQ